MKEDLILTIKDLNFCDAGKWVEFWFEEDIIPPIGQNGYQLACKQYSLWNAVDEVGLRIDIYKTGFIGKKTRWICNSHGNYELKEFENNGYE